MNTNKKLAVVCNYALNPNRIGGMDRFYVAYDKKAKELGYEVHWYFSSYKESISFFEDLTIFSSESSSVESFFINNLKQEKVSYHTLVTHFVALCTPFFKAAKKTGIKKIIAVDHNPRPLKGFPFKKQLKNKLKGLLYGNYINRFVGVSAYTKKHILKDFGYQLNAKTSVIYNGIDTAVFKKRNTLNKYKFIVTSHLRQSKGIQDLIVAISCLEQSIQQLIEIDIYGEGPFENELKELTSKYNLTEIIKFKGSTSQLNVLFSNYSYMIQPTYMECFSLSILESLASNVPVITTTVGGNLEIIEHGKNGFIFNPGAVYELTELLKNLLLDKIAIDTETYPVIENHFNLAQMVTNHINLLK